MLVPWVHWRFLLEIHMILSIAFPTITEHHPDYYTITQHDPYGGESDIVKLTPDQCRHILLDMRSYLESSNIDADSV